MPPANLRPLLLLLAPPKHTTVSFSVRSQTPTTTFASLIELGLSDKQLRQLQPLLHSTPSHFLHHRISKLRSLPFPLHRLISRHPDLLTDPDIDPFLDFLHQHISHLNLSKLHRLLANSPPRLFAHFTARIQLLLDSGVPHDKVTHILNGVKARKVFAEMPLEELRGMVEYLQSFGWPDIVVARPFILNLDFHTQLVPRVECLIELANGDRVDAAVLIKRLPKILAYSVDHVRAFLRFWRSAGFDGEQIYEIVMADPSMIGVSIDRKLKERVQFLVECGLDVDDMSKFLVRFPVFLNMSYENNMVCKLTMLTKIGYRPKTRELAFILGPATRKSCKNMQLVISLFLRFGFTLEDLLVMSKKHPQVLVYNHESMEEKMEFLTDVMERDIRELLAFPVYLGYKMERIKERYQARRTIGGKRMSINKLLSLSDELFAKRNKKQPPSSLEEDS